jgi:YHS domain-containing protein
MKFMTRFFALAFLAIAGCGGSNAPAPSATETPASASTAIATPVSPAAPATAAKTVSLTADEKGEIAKLAVKADQDSALAQATCPVSGENLGSMGVPIKVSAEGKTAYLCCKGCNKDFDKDPKAVFAKLGK